MKKYMLVLILFCFPAHAEILAQCKNPHGKSFMLNAGLYDKTHSGWNDDGITGQVVTLINDAGVYNIGYSDKYQTSTILADGGKIIEISKNNFLRSYLTIDTAGNHITYTFYRANDGRLEMMYVQNRTGSTVQMPKAAIFTADCDYVKFDK